MNRVEFQGHVKVDLYLGGRLFLFLEACLPTIPRPPFSMCSYSKINVLGVPPHPGRSCRSTVVYHRNVLNHGYIVNALNGGVGVTKLTECSTRSQSPF